jgi:hypothetical protein
MSRAVTAALVSLLDGLTLTDSGLTGSPVSLDERVRVVTPREAVSPEATPVCYVVLSAVQTEADGILWASTAVYEVMVHLSYTAEAEAMLAGAEALDQLAAALRYAPGTLADEVTLGAGSVVLDRERGRVACYARVTCRTLRG